MRKLLCSVLLLTALLMLFAAPAYADDPTPVTTPEGLAAIARDPGGNYVLGADIDLAGVDWTPFAFSGTLDGGGHTIRNLTVVNTGAETRETFDGNGRSYETRFAGLFSVLEGATVENLTIRNADVRVSVTVNGADGTPNGDNAAGAYAGGLAGYAAGSAIRDCAFSGTVRLSTNAKSNGAGGLAGYVEASAFERVKSAVTLVLTDTDRAVRDENFLGGVYASGYAHLTDSTVNIDGYDSCHGYVHSGGLIGMYYPRGFAYDEAPTCTITGNTVNGAIHFFEDNPDRRAYCEGLIGEIVNWHIVYEKNSPKGFVRDERYSYDVDLSPETVGRSVSPNYTAFTEYAAGDTVTLLAPGGSPIVGVYCVFWEEPGAYTFSSTEKRGSETKYATLTVPAGDGMLQNYVDLAVPLGRPDELTVTFDTAAKVCGLYPVIERDLASDGSLPAWVHDWSGPCEKADVMLLSTHADDEQLFFAGILPYYSAVRGYDVQVVYLTDHIYELRRHHERLNGLWEVGIRNCPVSLHLPDSYADTYDYALLTAEYLGFSKESLVSDVRAVIERFEPKVIVGHDEAGEYGHGQHMLYTALLEEALADGWAEQHPYLERVFLHLYAENPVTLSFLDTPYDALGGKTPFQKTQDGFRHHETQFWTWFRGWLYGSDGSLTKASGIETYSPLYYGQYYGGGYEPVAAKGDLFAGLMSYGEERAEAERLLEEQRAAEEARKAAEEAAKAALEDKKEEEEDLRIREAAKARERRTGIILIVVTVLALFGGAAAAVLGRKNRKY